MKNLPNFNIDEVMQAIIADEPDLTAHQDSLKTALTQLQNGEFTASNIRKFSLSQVQIFSVAVSSFKSKEPNQQKTIKLNKISPNLSPIISKSIQIRKRNNLSHSQLARILHIPVKTLILWEQGQRKPSGSAKVLLNLLAKHPKLIDELATSSS